MLKYKSYIHFLKILKHKDAILIYCIFLCLPSGCARKIAKYHNTPDKEKWIKTVGCSCRIWNHFFFIKLKIMKIFLNYIFVKPTWVIECNMKMWKRLKTENENAQGRNNCTKAGISRMFHMYSKRQYSDMVVVSLLIKQVFIIYTNIFVDANKTHKKWAKRT